MTTPIDILWEFEERFAGEFEVGCPIGTKDLIYEIEKDKLLTLIRMAYEKGRQEGEKNHRKF